MDSKQYELIFADFIRRRQALNPRLDQCRLEIDAWFRNNPPPSSLRSLAVLEALLKKRRDILVELQVMYDDFLGRLATFRHEVQQADVEDPA